LVRAPITQRTSADEGMFFSEIGVTLSAISFDESFGLSICPSIIGQWARFRQ
jgi:hypothetical protein